MRTVVPLLLLAVIARSALASEQPPALTKQVVRKANVPARFRKQALQVLEKADTMSWGVDHASRLFGTSSRTITSYDHGRDPVGSGTVALSWGNKPVGSASGDTLAIVTSTKQGNGNERRFSRTVKPAVGGGFVEYLELSANKDGAPRAVAKAFWLTPKGKRKAQISLSQAHALAMPASR